MWKWKLPPELVDEIIDASDLETLLQFSLTSKDWSIRSQNRIFSKIMFWGDVEEYGFDDWFSKENRENLKRFTPFVKAIFYNCNYGAQLGPPRQNTEDLLSPFTEVESLRLASASLCWTPNFKTLKTVRSLSLESCFMAPKELLDYLQSFPQLEFLSISAPNFFPTTTIALQELRDSQRRLSTRRVALRLERVVPSGLLLDALSAVSFAFTEIHLIHPLRTRGVTSLSSFLERTKETVTKIKIDCESPLRHTRHTTLCVNRNLFLS